MHSSANTSVVSEARSYIKRGVSQQTLRYVLYRKINQDLFFQVHKNILGSFLCSSMPDFISSFTGPTKYVCTTQRELNTYISRRKN
ncbi:hypothetical protein I7I53_05071 [Histoplasma capsulatum var. duboisii H88]|uniref:Uncharacterized protein n=1 Tax=Ajellomyces capsulatus (strain H88) TaxID=544711 RepID=A0A8A1LXX1_AJEC8|nr:hypothetical protein I7I53_05071 [Histoplasma capsulatum var. duboisii H88]